MNPSTNKQTNKLVFSCSLIYRPPGPNGRRNIQARERPIGHRYENLQKKVHILIWEISLLSFRRMEIPETQVGDRRSSGSSVVRSRSKKKASSSKSKLAGRSKKTRKKFKTTRYILIHTRNLSKNSITFLKNFFEVF